MGAWLFGMHARVAATSSSPVPADCPAPPAPLCLGAGGCCHGPFLPSHIPEAQCARHRVSGPAACAQRLTTALCMHHLWLQLVTAAWAANQRALRALPASPDCPHLLGHTCCAYTCCPHSTVVNKTLPAEEDEEAARKRAELEVCTQPAPGAALAPAARVSLQWRCSCVVAIGVPASHTLPGA